MARQQTLRRSFQDHAVQRAFEAEIELNRVDVLRVCIIVRVEEQAFLQRRQRQDVFDPRIPALDPFDLGLRQRNQREVARTMAAELLRMTGQRFQDLEPTGRNFANRVPPS